MEHPSKIRVAVLFGGRSAEHEVSLQSAKNVIQQLDKTLFEVIPIGIDKKGNWLLGEEVFKKSLEQATVPQLMDDSQAWFTTTWIAKETISSHHLPAELITKQRQFDVVFPVMHGTFSEDGSLQGLLELAQIPYVGCNVIASAIGMNKEISKRLAMQANFPVAPYLAFKKAQWADQATQCIAEIEKHIGYPLFVKPVNTGSSIGITKVKSRETLSTAIDRAFQFDVKVLIEKALEVMEIEVAVLESLAHHDDPIVSVVGEVKPHHEFYSYEAKYLDKEGASLIIPATLPEATTHAIRQMAKQLFTLLECEGMARVDLFLEKTTRKLYFNEINTIPGFTQISMYPKLMEASGVTYTQLLTHLIQLAIKRHQDKSQLIYDV